MLSRCEYAIRKLLFVEQDKWFRSPQLSLSSPIITILKLDPFERFHEARGCDEWAENRSWIFGQIGPSMAKFSFLTRPIISCSKDITVRLFSHLLIILSTTGRTVSYP